MLTDLGRRVLGHLPAWAEDEAAFVEAEGGPEVSIRSYSTPELHERLGEDPFTPSLHEEELESHLQTFAERGLVELDEEGRWRKTQAGHEAMHAPPEGEQIPGAVYLDLAPAQANSEAHS